MSVMLRLFGAALVVFTGWAAGWHLAEKKRRRLAVLEQLERLIALVQDEIVYRAAPLSDILVLLKERRDMPGLCLADCGQLQRLACPPDLDRPAWNQMEGFFTRLGSAAGQEEARHCAYYLRRCAGLRDEARREYEQAKRLYAKAGLCCGALAALLLF